MKVKVTERVDALTVRRSRHGATFSGTAYQIVERRAERAGMVPIQRLYVANDGEDYIVSILVEA